MYAVFKSAQTAGHVFIYFYNNFGGSFTYSCQMGSIWPEIEKSVFVHG